MYVRITQYNTSLVIYLFSDSKQLDDSNDNNFESIK